MKITYFTLLLFLFSNCLFSQENKHKELRKLSPDRPHQTESPITVDKWHVMIETDLVNLTQKKTPTEQLNSLGFGLANLKFGFHKRMDIEVISGIYNQNIYKNKTLPDSKAYVQDLTFRYKYNLIGNDSGSLAIAIMPLVRTTNFFKEKMQVLNGGLLLNVEKDLGFAGLGYTGGLSQFSFDPLLKQFELFSTVSLDYKVVGGFHNFVELSYRYNKYADFLHTYSFDSGITFTPNKNLQFDTGFYFFLPAKSPFIFIGGTLRI
ncbi:MAG: hypothetical protein H0U95_03925 [Bacteroidetes bacterium]|nr:hypothetical protein [Bacteroidota bacterium]